MWSGCSPGSGVSCWGNGGGSLGTLLDLRPIPCHAKRCCVKGTYPTESTHPLPLCEVKPTLWRGGPSYAGGTHAKSHQYWAGQNSRGGGRQWSVGQDTT